MSGATRGYKKLLAFQAAHDMVKMTYRVTEGFPKHELFGLTSQMRRAAVSIAANIVEGYVMSSTALFARHLDISFGSCKELEYYYDLVGELGYAKQTDVETAQQMCGRAACMVSALSKSLKFKMSKPKSKSGSIDASEAESLRSLHSFHSLHSLHSKGEVYDG